MSESDEFDELQRACRIRVKSSVKRKRADSPDSWDEGFRDDQAASQVEAAQVGELCDNRSESGSEAESSSSSGFKLREWWSQLLLEAAQHLGLQWPGKVSKPLIVVSGCTGSSAESAVFKAGQGFCLS